jgi:hypothetical protein
VVVCRCAEAVWLEPGRAAEHVAARVVMLGACHSLWLYGC